MWCWCPSRTRGGPRVHIGRYFSKSCCRLLRDTTNSRSRDRTWRHMGLDCGFEWRSYMLGTSIRQLLALKGKKKKKDRIEDNNKYVSETKSTAEKQSHNIGIRVECKQTFLHSKRPWIIGAVQICKSIYKMSQIFTVYVVFQFWRKTQNNTPLHLPTVCSFNV